MRYEIVLYVLKLRDGCYYVGQSANVHKRIDAHMESRGAVWTQVHPPIGILETKRTWTDDQKSAEEMENILTIRTMQDYGWRNVRGGWFCNTDEMLTEKGLRAHGLFDLLESREKNCIRRDNGRLEQRAPELSCHPAPEISHREKIAISSVGSCDAATRLGYYEVLVEYSSARKYLRRQLTDTTVNRCIIRGFIEGVENLRGAYDVKLVSATSLGLSEFPKVKGPNADILKVLVSALQERGCTFTFEVVGGQGDELRKRIRLSNAK